MFISASDIIINNNDNANNDDNKESWYLLGVFDDEEIEKSLIELHEEDVEIKKLCFVVVFCRVACDVGLLFGVFDVADNLVAQSDKRSVQVIDDGETVA